MEITEMKVNHLETPTGFAMDYLVFSWKVINAAGKKPQRAELRVMDEEGRKVYESPENILPDSAAFEVQTDLKPRTRYFWTVWVQDETNGEATRQSWFETGKMQEEWNAVWITCTGGDRHPVFRRSFTVRKEIRKARLYICGLGLYEAEINGAKVSGEYLTPYCTDYNEWIQYQTYDVTEMLQKENTLRVLLGNGWYKGKFGFEAKTEEGYYGNEFKLLAELRIAYEDGETEVIGTDESWLVSRSNIVFSSIYDGEIIDDTLPPAEEETALAAEAPAGKLCDRLSPPVCVHETYSEPKMILTPAGETVLDLEQEITGIFTLRVNEEAGTKIHIQTGEVLQDGNFYRDNLRTAKSEFIYISDGKPKEVRPHFTFFGFRYVKISGMKNFSPQDFTAMALYSEVPDTGCITTGSPLVNQLLSNIRWGMRDNFLDVPTDCPQRDERMGWTGDAQVFSSAAMYMADTFAFYRKYLHDMALEQKHRGGRVPQVVPNFGKEGTSSAWGDAAAIIPWNLYQFYGDPSILKEQFESMSSWVDYIVSKDEDSHRWRYEFHYGDWLALDHPVGKGSGFLGGTDERFVADVYFFWSADLTCRAAAVLGYTEAQKKYSAIRDRQKQWIRDEYFTKTGKCCIRTQTAQLLTLKHDLSVNPEEALTTLATLLDESGGKLQTGFVGTPILCSVLSEWGMSERAWDLFLNEEFPGWLNEVKLGATTIWERWNSLDENGKITGTQMNSMNHYAAGSVAAWVYCHAAGISALEPGFRKARIAPECSVRLGSLKASCNTPYGKYGCEWTYMDDSRLNITVTVPFGGEAEVCLPDCDEPVTLDAGTYTFTCHTGSEAKKLGVDSSMASLLKNTKLKEFIATLIPLEQLPAEFMPMTFRKLAKQFGDAPEELLARLDITFKSMQ